MNIKVIVFGASLSLLLFCGAPEQAKQLKIYQDGLEPLLGKSITKTTKVIADTWKFGLLGRWQAQNPTVETVLKNNFRVHGFSKGEAQAIFSSPGLYDAMLFLKLLSDEKVKTGTIDEMGLPILAESQSFSDRRYVSVRLVFKDGQLVHYRVW
jgi:hypothetical protein